MSGSLINNTLILSESSCFIFKILSMLIESFYFLLELKVLGLEIIDFWFKLQFFLHLLFDKRLGGVL